MAAPSIMGPVYASSPQQNARTSVSSEETNVEHHLVVGMSALQSHDNDAQNYVPSQWSGCLGASTGSDEFNNYALHSSPQMTDLHQSASAQSSPRTWDSPAQLGPTPWEAATEQLHNRYHDLDPQLSGYLSSSHHGSIPTSFPVDSMPFLPSQSFDGSDNEYPRARSQTEPYPAGYRTSPQDEYASTPESVTALSPCSTTLTMPMGDDAPSSPGDDVNSQAPTLVAQGSERQTSHANRRNLVTGPGDIKGDEPYAKLIYLAFLSTPRRAMTLQEIYQWFRENTAKGKSDTKGWQNSIRHNLSMNQAFTKRDRKPSNAGDGDEKSSGTTQTDNKKSTEWYLEPWAIGGVQSTTRYRKGNQSRRSATSHRGLASRVYRSYPAQQHHHHHSFSGSSSSSRRGAGARFLKSTRLPIRSAPTGPSAVANHLAQYHFLPAHPNRQPFGAGGVSSIHPLVNDPSSSPYNNTTPAQQPYFQHQNHHSTGTATAATSDYDYDYPDPQFFPSATQTVGGPTPGMARSASSEPGVEPVTPEPFAPVGSYYSGVDAVSGVVTTAAGEQQSMVAMAGYGIPGVVPQVYADYQQGWGGQGHHGGCGGGEMEMEMEGVTGAGHGVYGQGPHGQGF